MEQLNFPFFDGRNEYCRHHEKCNDYAIYTLEWISVNQHGKNPIVSYEIDVCQQHLVANVDHPRIGSADMITDADTNEREFPAVLEKVIKGYQNGCL